MLKKGDNIRREVFFGKFKNTEYESGVYFSFRPLVRILTLHPAPRGAPSSTILLLRSLSKILITKSDIQFHAEQLYFYSFLAY